MRLDSWTNLPHMPTQSFFFPLPWRRIGSVSTLIHPMFSRTGGTYGELILHKTSNIFWKITSNPPTSSETHRKCSMVLLIYMAPLGPMKKAMWKSFTKTILATYSRPSAYSLSDFSPGSAHCSGWPPGILTISEEKKLQEVNLLNLLRFKIFEKLSKNSKYLGVLVANSLNRSKSEPYCFFSK